MTTIIKILTVFITTFLLSCNSQSNDTKNYHSRDTFKNKTLIQVDTPRSFVKNYGVYDSNQLFVFVGREISIAPLPHKRHSMDNGFKAKYAILKKVYGEFPEDTIEFVVYDHYGIPNFSKFKNVLLYVSADSGTYYHQKYMFSDVYKTKEGRWAGSYAKEDYEHKYNRHTKVKPVKIDFAERIVYPITIDDEGVKLKLSYPKPYFKIVGDSAIAIYGNYVEDLFKLKRDGYLTARGLFGDEKLHIK